MLVLEGKGITVTIMNNIYLLATHWLRQLSIHLQGRRLRFDPWVGKIPHRREWLPTAVFLPGVFHGQRSLVGYSPWGHRESDTTEHSTPLFAKH